MKLFNTILMRILIIASIAILGIFSLHLLMVWLSEAYHFSAGEIHLRGFAISCVVFILCASSNIPQNILRLDLLFFTLMYGCYFAWTFTSSAAWLPFALVGLGTLGIVSFVYLYWKHQ